MNSSPDDIGQVKSDFLAWLKQNNSGGDAWFLDEGPVEVVEAPSAAPVAASPTPAATKPEVQPAKPVPAPVPTSAPDPFLEECASFVHQTLASLEKQPALAVDLAGPLNAKKALAELAAEVQGCHQCPLHESRTQTVFGAGSPRADIMFIGEAPGRDEDLQGQPFVGKSGQLLSKIIEAIDFSRDDVFIANILKCRPPHNRDPLPSEVACCESYLKMQLSIIQPRVICCLGRVAAQTLLKTEASLGALRQTAHFYEGIPVMATYHPAALLRNPGWKRDTWNDIRKLRALHDALVSGASDGPAEEH